MKTPNRLTGTRHSRALARIRATFDRIPQTSGPRAQAATMARAIAAEVAHATLGRTLRFTPTVVVFSHANGKYGSHHIEA